MPIRHKNFVCTIVSPLYRLRDFSTKATIDSPLEQQSTIRLGASSEKQIPHLLSSQEIKPIFFWFIVLAHSTPDYSHCHLAFVVGFCCYFVKKKKKKNIWNWFSYILISDYL